MGSAGVEWEMRFCGRLLGEGESGIGVEEGGVCAPAVSLGITSAASGRVEGWLSVIFVRVVPEAMSGVCADRGRSRFMCMFFVLGIIDSVFLQVDV